LTIACAGAVVAAAWGSVLVDGSSLDTLAGPGYAGLAYALCVLLLFVNRILVYEADGRSMETLGTELLVVSYAGLLTAVTVQLRWVAGAEAGYLVLGSLVIAAKCGDTGAYFAGRAWGRRQMAPRLSPKKTWAGALGALFGSTIGAVLWLQLATGQFDTTWHRPAWYWAALCGAIIGAAGLMGDLVGSLIKRDVGVKDSAALLPGMGGVLDVLDSILFAGPVAYVLWLVMPLKT